MLLHLVAWSAALRGALLAIVTLQLATAGGGVLLGEVLLARLAARERSSVSCDVARR